MFPHIHKSLPKPHHHRPKRREYDPVVDPLLTRWAAQRHLGIKEAAHRLGVPATLLRQWIKQYPEIAQAITTGERAADAQVIEALFKRATGYNFENSDTTASKTDRDGIKRKVKQSKRHRPPSVEAIFFWLKNRLPDQWADNPESPTPAEIIARVRRISQTPPPTLSPHDSQSLLRNVL